MATAIHIKSESGDDYLYCVEENLTDEEAAAFCTIHCDEEPEHWLDFDVVQSVPMVEVIG